MANQKFIKALNNKKQSTPPVWMMRQAGRYHPPYQTKRKEHSFIDLCKKPKLAAQVALDPIEDFDFDVSILFSDLLFPLEALGMGLEYIPGPQLGWHLSDLADLKKMNNIESAIQQLLFQKEALEETRKILPDDKSLIGFVGGTWTLFVYAVCGSHKGHLIDAKQKLELYRAFNDILVPLLKKNIQLQLDGGAEVVMVFDTAAGELSPIVFNQYVAPILLEIAKSFPNKLGYYSKGTTQAHVESLWESNLFAGFGYDHRWDLTKMFNRQSGFTQGNFDQTLLFLNPKDFEKAVMDFLNPFLKLPSDERKGWVCGLGHGVLPQTPNENVRRFVQLIREVFGG